MKCFYAMLGTLTLLSGCVGVTPYPNISPIAGAQVSANPYEPGTRQYCAEYGRQTAGNAFSNRVDLGDGEFGSDLLVRQRAVEDGRQAYRRCLAGRLN